MGTRANDIASLFLDGTNATISGNSTDVGDLTLARFVASSQQV